MWRLAIVLALLVPSSAGASDSALLAAQDRFLPAVQARYASTPDGAQARYDAGRDLVEAVLAAGPVTPERRRLRVGLLASGRAQVAHAEGLDRGDGFRSAAPLAPLPGSSVGFGPRRPDATLTRRLAAAAARVNGAAGIWVHDLSTGRYAVLRGGHAVRGGFHGQARRARRRGARLADAGAQPLVVRREADRLLVVEPRREPDRGRTRLRRDRGRAAPARDDLEHLSRAVPRDHRVASSGPHTRVTTAHDLGRALHQLQRGRRRARAAPARPLAGRRSSRCACSRRRSRSGRTRACFGPGCRE